MASSPVPLDLEEHREFARELQGASVRMRELCGVLAGVYGHDSRPAYTMRRAIEWIESTRREMQVQADRDIPGLAAGLYR